MRIPGIERDDAQPDALEYYDRDIAKYGRVLGNTKAYAHNVPVLRAMKDLLAAYAETDALPLSEKALVRTRVAILNGCPF